jgi:uncharacterized protein (DUF1810 family)
MEDPHDLTRFVSAQDDGGVYARVLAELRQGRKTSHWMWFVFPQIAGLGHSAMSRQYAISSLEEARAYMRHGTLGPRLLECARLVTGAPPHSAEQVFGAIDATKLRSSMTLFLRAIPDEPLFALVLKRHFASAADEATDRLLDRQPRGLADPHDEAPPSFS